MLRTRLVPALFAFAASVVLCTQTLAATLAEPDASVYTTFSGSATSVQWTVCGATAQSEGCYGSGSLGPFVAVGAMLESDIISINGAAVTRYMYIVDTGATPVSLHVYKKTISVSTSSVSTVITPYKTIPLLPLVGGTNVPTFMAANGKFLFIGTSLSANAVRVTKNDLALQVVGGFSPAINVTSITSDPYGNVIVAQGNGQSSGFSLFGPDGNTKEDGGGNEFIVGTTQAVPASLLLHF